MLFLTLCNAPKPFPASRVESQFKIKNNKNEEGERREGAGERERKGEKEREGRREGERERE